MPRRNTPDHSYFDSVSTQLELSVGRSCSGVVSNVESNTASGIFPGLNVVDTGLKAGMAYHRFRYYSPETGAYISQDPIRLEAGLTNLYAYVHDVNAWVEPWGLNNIKTGAGRTHVTYRGTKNGLPYTGYASAPSNLGLTPDEIIAYRYGGNFDEFGGVAPKAVYSGDGVEGKQIARDLEQRLYEGDLKATGGDTKKVANRQNPVGVKNPNRDKYLAAADEHLKTKGIH